MGILDWFKGRDLNSVLNKSYRVKVHGVVFYVKKLNPLDFMSGSKALSQIYDTYKTQGEKQAQVDAVLLNQNKLKDHYADVFMSSVVSPKLVRDKEDQSGIWVYNLFTDWDLANELYQEISQITYGKKKLKSLISQRKK